ncbi:molybdenum cofactor biosynthesis F family protein [Pseudomonas oryzihabitans]|uniref:molybdenum cofactor biosynthesis F family protein n=1 Tax=Pseudomonas oryzihabitans TaxID=47885 RepID=UPI00135E5384|nr:molybdenum cofactor biosynthesis F family protein [Pseudomonas oryzihabitans]MXS18828.1 molybdenum cofactor biosynthesis protein F [Pseudomonas oryzihabitans]
MSSTSDWITVGALADGFAPEGFVLPANAALQGRHLTLHFANGWRIEHRFTAERLEWHLENGGGEASYRATTLRPEVFLVDFIKRENDQDWSVTLVLDLPNQAFTAVLGRLPTLAATREGLYARALAGQSLTGVEVEILHGSLDRPWQDGACPHAPTRELVGLRNLYRYSPTEGYEHIYLNENFYTWQCLQGVEGGLTDTDRCHYYRIAEHLYLFVWREKIVPTLGVLLIDLDQHRSDGKIWGYSDADCQAWSNFPVASHCQVLNRTEYPA